MAFSWKTLFGLGINEISNPFEKRKAQLQNKGFLSSVGTVTGLVNQFSSGISKINYAESLERAASQRASNVRAISQAQIASVLQMADIEANQLELNASVLEVQAINFQRAASTDYINSFSDVAALQGRQTAGFASAGVTMSGSALDVVNNSRERATQQIDGEFLQAINQTNQLYSQATQTRFDAAMTRFSATEQARFIGLTTSQRLS